MPSQQEPLKLVYIAGVSYSGSTLLDLVLGSHSRIVSVGELKGFSTGRDQCSCAAPTIWECPFWIRVGEKFSRTLGVPLSDVQLASDDDGEFVAHNRALLEAIRAVSNKDVIVDSSKSAARLARLIQTGAVDRLFPVHLHRPPQAVVYSNIKRRIGLAVPAYRYGRRTSQIRAVLEGHDHRVIRYEELSRMPERIVGELMQWIGLSFEPAQLHWAARERHNFGGNPMRTTRDSTIRPDLSWRTGLAGWQRASIAALELTGRWAPGANRWKRRRAPLAASAKRSGGTP